MKIPINKGVFLADIDGCIKQVGLSAVNEHDFRPLRKYFPDRCGKRRKKRTSRKSKKIAQSF